MNTPRRPQILWADDEIDLLQPHIMLLEKNGYDVTSVNNGLEAVDRISEGVFDLVFLDENMPGIGGIETLKRIHSLRPHLPIVMITKNEEEHTMDEAYGASISDYLIKPVIPQQLLAVLKRFLHVNRLQSQQLLQDFQLAYRDITMQMMGRLSASAWIEIYRQIVHFQLKLTEAQDAGMLDMLQALTSQVDQEFTKFYERNFEEWMAGPGEDVPMLSHRLLPERLMPLLQGDDPRPIYLIVIDNLRLDQWELIEPMIQDKWRVKRKAPYFSILPTATQYARNALFAGLNPAEIARVHPQWWTDERDEGGKNNHEQELFEALLKRMGYSQRSAYFKVIRHDYGRKFVDQFHTTKENGVTAVVYNFVDQLSHARTDSDVIKQLTEGEAGYRSLTASWFKNSTLREAMDRMAEAGARVIVTTDHGTIRVEDSVVVRGERDTNTNPRYKVGKNLGYDAKEVFEVRNPEAFGLPRRNIADSYIFAKGHDFLVYPNNQSEHVRRFKGTFQHGGISMDEVIIPWVELDPR
jgi:CheY-like chemotaxis protein